MHVALFGAYPPPHGGVQTHIVSLRKFLQSLGIRCSVVTTTRAKSATEEGVYHPHSAAAVLRTMARLRADIWHIHLGGVPQPREFGLCLACSWVPRSRSVLTLHSGGYPASPQGLAARPDTAIGYTLRSLDHLIAVNQAIQGVFLRYGVPESRTSVIEPYSPGQGVVASAISPTIMAFIAAHSPVFLSVGLLEPEYNIPFQINLMPALRKRWPEAGLLIIGSGSQASDLAQQVSGSPEAPHIQLCGDVPHDQTLATISRAGALLRLTSYDGDAISVREALHFGTPVVATDTGLRPGGVHLVPSLDGELVVRAVAEALAQVPTGRAEPAVQNLQQVVRIYEQILQ